MEEEESKSNPSEDAARAIIRRYAQELPRALLTGKFHKMLEHHVATMIGALKFFKQEAKRKKPANSIRNSAKRSWPKWRLPSSVRSPIFRPMTWPHSSR
jgi:hypothetical protein